MSKTTVPTLNSAEVTHFAPDTIVLTFNEDIAANANVNKADFAIIITETNSNTAGTNGNGVVATSAKGFVVPSTIGITGAKLGVTTTTAGTAPGTLTLTFTHPVQLVSGNSFVLTLDRKIFTNDGTSTTCTATTGGSSLTLTSKTVSGSGSIMTVVLGATSTAGKQIILACTDNMDNNAAVIGTIIRYGLSAIGNGAIKFGSIGYTITDSVSGSETPPTTISTVSISDGKINLILTAPVTDTQSLTVSYLKHSTANRNIKDAANNAVATFTLQSVDNNVNAVDVLPPTFNYAEVLHARPNRVIITFTEDIVLNTNINAGDFAVVVAGSSATISSAAVTSVDAAYVAHYDVNGVYAHLTGYGKVGNKCHVECSNRGICDHSNGICDCFNGFIGSACERVNVLAGIN